MMHLYCSCGYPITAVAHWDGRDFNISLHAEAGEAENASIASCPQCGQPVRLGALKQQSPRRLGGRPLLDLDWLHGEGLGDQASEYAR